MHFALLVPEGREEPADLDITGPIVLVVTSFLPVFGNFFNNSMFDHSWHFNVTMKHYRENMNYGGAPTISASSMNQLLSATFPKSSGPSDAALIEL